MSTFLEFKVPCSGEGPFLREAPFLLFLFLREVSAEASAGLASAAFRLCIPGSSTWVWVEGPTFSVCEAGYNIVDFERSGTTAPEVGL